MSLHRPRLACWLLVVLGVVGLWAAAGVAGSETTALYQYTAYEVSHDGDELVLTDDGERRRHVTVDVDENVVCLPSTTRDCNLTRQEFDGEITSTGVGSTFSHAYLDGEFYRLEANMSDDLEFWYAHTEPETAFDQLAIADDRLVDAERKILAEGDAITRDPIPHANRLLESDGDYYTIQRSGFKEFHDGGSFCSSSADGFCAAADTVRRIDRLTRYGLGGLGLLGIGVGGVGLVRSFRS
ncbi:hypothetical protein [Halopiger goleimassiliensis]|uniref:hypothetical protein n=1 Tax=Halopiger goleimassiliensis TaxID=1293048 RepID=UPI000677D6C5|nr:hypothetical protein [Halopiger goleimassiliensis]